MGSPPVDKNRLRCDCHPPPLRFPSSSLPPPTPLFSYSNGQKDRWTCNDTLLLTTLTITIKREKEKLYREIEEKKIRLFHFPFNEMTQNRQQLKSSAANSFSFGRCPPPLSNPSSLFFLMPFFFVVPLLILTLPFFKKKKGENGQKRSQRRKI